MVGLDTVERFRVTEDHELSLPPSQDPRRGKSLAGLSHFFFFFFCLFSSLSLYYPCVISTSKKSIIITNVPEQSTLAPAASSKVRAPAAVDQPFTHLPRCHVLQCMV